MSESEQSGTASDGGSEQSGTAERQAASSAAERTSTRPASALTAVGGAARVFAQTARGLGLDLVSAVVWAGENAADLATRNRRDPGSAGATEDPMLSTLRVDVLILSDEAGVPLTTADRVAPALQRADRIFTQYAGIRVRCAGIRTVTEPAPTTALDPHADRGLLLDEILGRTAFYREHLPARGMLSVVGDPVTVVVVRTIAGRATGCSLGMTADWVVVQASLFDPANRNTYDETVLAHELGHALNLPHHRGPDNLMRGVSSPPDGIRGTALAGWQALLLRANRHTVPPVRGDRASG